MVLRGCEHTSRAIEGKTIDVGVVVEKDVNLDILSGFVSFANEFDALHCALPHFEGHINFDRDLFTGADGMGDSFLEQAPFDDRLLSL